jgi:hypothetical protein
MFKSNKMNSHMAKELMAEEEDKHIGCPSWPNCDLAPGGCKIESGEDVEWYGWK